MARAQIDQIKSVQSETLESFGKSPGDQRKRLGQYFTGRRLGRLLAALAVGSQTRTVVDPMCGTGDLLEAAALIADAQGVTLECLFGVEIDPMAAAACRSRIAELVVGGVTRNLAVETGNAFDLGMISALAQPTYDCVIANPPYVRYQSLTEACPDTSAPSGPVVRNGLLTIADCLVREHDRDVWRQLIKGYSGHADLSIPSWMLCAMLVEPGGTLALVVPATWRTREYADIIRYLMTWAFEIQVIVEDSQPGWFSDALVRTNLVVARRRMTTAPIRSVRKDEICAHWVTIDPAAANDTSLVGMAFPVEEPELAFARWLDDDCAEPVEGIKARRISSDNERAWLQSHASRRSWYRRSEQPPEASFGEVAVQAIVPHALLSMVSLDKRLTMVTPASAGIQIGQGLRTGCNRFFYPETVGAPSADSREVLVELPELFPNQIFELPRSVLRPVLRRQSEIPLFLRGEPLKGQLLDLRDWVLPEDVTSESAGGRSVMHGDLADLVRAASKLNLGSAAKPIYIPGLSAVRTNVRSGSKGTSRFWYNLPGLVARHTPDLFVPRVIHRAPTVIENSHPPTIIDANFSTIWTEGNEWSQAALAALFNSSWCRACMELLGTPMGGGALKLEAAQLRRLPLPSLTPNQKKELERRVNGAPIEARHPSADDVVLAAVTGQTGAGLARSAEALHQLVEKVRSARQR